MTRYFLTRIKVEGFRGINNENQALELKFKADAVNSIFAQNGTGKSSLFEALCYAIKGSVPKLRGLQASEKPDSYITNLFHSGSTATIELDLTSEAGVVEQVVVTRTSSGARVVTSPTGTTNPDALLESLNEDFTLLDYAQFNEFINNTPLERGRSFSALLGLSGYSAMRQVLQGLTHGANLNQDFSLKELKTAVGANEQRANSALVRFKGHYNALTGKDVVDTSTVGQWGQDIRDALAGIELLKPVVGESKLSEIDFDQLRQTVQGAEGGPKRQELTEALRSLVLLEAVVPPSEDEIKTEIGLLRSDLEQHKILMEESRGALFRSLQEAGQALLTSTEWDEPNACPLCDSTLEHPLIDHVADQLKLFDVIKTLEESVRKVATSSQWLQYLAQLEGLVPLDLDAAEHISSEVRSILSLGRFSVHGVHAVSARLQALSKVYADKTALTKRTIAGLEKELPPSLVSVTTQIEHGVQAREALGEYWSVTKDLKTKRGQLVKYKRWQTFVERAADDLCRAEADLSQARLSALGGKYQQLFQSIMLSGDVVPELKRSDMGEQLDVQLEDFHGRSGLSARALLSESYRNALAISVFLSAATTQPMVPRFVVLDDITSSFDAGHQWRLMDEIRLSLQYKGVGTDGLQFIMLSHDGLLEKYFDSVSSGPDWHHQKLQGIPSLGAITAVGQTADRIRKTAVDFLNAGQTSAAEPLIRQYLEFALLQIIRKVEIPVPYDFAIRDQMKMVSNCLTAITDAVKLHAAAGSLVLEAQQVIDLETRFVPALIGNWVSHYATAVGASVSPQVLLGVLQSVDGLIDCFKLVDATKSPPAKTWYKSLSRV